MPASAWYVSTDAIPQLISLANGEDNTAATALKEASEARLWSSAHSIRKLEKNINTPVTRCVMEA